MLKMLRNSLCQFCNDPNQKRDVPTYPSVPTGHLPACTCSTLNTSAPPRRNKKAKRRNGAVTWLRFTLQRGVDQL